MDWKYRKELEKVKTDEESRLERKVVVTPDVNSGHEIFSCSDLACIELPLVDRRR